MKTINIGSLSLKNLTPDQLMNIAEIEGVHLYFEVWDKMEMLDFSNTMFSDTLVVDFSQKKLSNISEKKTIVFFFNFKDFHFHWHFKNDERNTRESKRLKLESIKYLLDEGFDLPLY